MVRARNYVKVRSLEEAWELNQKRSNMIVAGLAWIKMENINKQTLIDLSGLGLDQIEETEEGFNLGCMCTLRQLETDQRLNSAFNGIFKECTRNIVGVQFRNGATIGGSVFGRFGFSDLLTALLVLDSYVEIYPLGVIPLEEFLNMPYDNDILVRIIIKKDNRNSAYITQRRTKTDFPLITVAVAKKDEQWSVAIGARPSKAKLVQLSEQEKQYLGIDGIIAQYNFGSNLRGSGEYRRELAGIYLQRLFQLVDQDKS